MTDIERAKDYLLAGEDNIPGRAFSNSIPHETKDVLASVISGLNSFKQNSSSIQSTVFWLNVASNSFIALIPLSTYSDGQLNLRYINTLTQQLAAIRPYIKDIDGTTVANFLRFLRDELNKEGWEEKLVEFLNDISTELVSDIKKNDQLEQLINGIKESSEELKKLLTEPFIKKIQHIISFWPQFIATVPTWKHLAGVFFITMLFTATSIPKYLNAFKVISDTIIQQKGVGPYLLIVLPMLATTLLLFPLNIAINLTETIAWQALKASIQIIINGLALLSAAFNLLFSLNPTSNKKLSVEAFKIFEACFNVFIRLPLKMIIDLLDAATFILTNKYLLSFLSEALNNSLDSLLNLIRPKDHLTQSQKEENTELVLAEQDQQTPKKQSEQINLGFFANDSIYNESDVWLDDLLESFTTQQQSIPTMV
jgi:hypothetical protein